MSIKDELAINSAERSFGPEMSEEELAKFFGEVPPSERPAPPTKTTEDLRKLDEEIKYSEEITRIKARVQNEIGFGGGAMTNSGEMMINTFVHLFKAMYDFSNTLKDEEEKKALKALIRSQEVVPGNLAHALGAGVRAKKK